MARVDRGRGAWLCAATLLGPWLERWAALEKKTWADTPPMADALAPAQNARNLLKSLFVSLAMPKPEPAGSQVEAREAVLATLQRIRR